MMFTPVLMLRATLAAARTGFAAGLAAGRVAFDTGLAAGWALRATTGFFAGLALVTFFAAALRAGCFFFSVFAAALGRAAPWARARRPLLRVRLSLP